MTSTKSPDGGQPPSINGISTASTPAPGSFKPPTSGSDAAPPASPPSPSLMDLSADDLLERALAGDAMAAFIVTVKSRDSASGITAEDAERVRLGAFEQPLPEPDPKIMAQIEGAQYADIFGTMDSEQRGRYLAENPWVGPEAPRSSTGRS